MYASNIFIEPRGMARLSAVDFSAVLREESETVGTFMVDRESLAYMTPERFLGLPHSQVTDHVLEALLTTMEESGVKAPGQLEAWRRTLTPAVEFMCECQGLPAPE